MADPQDPLSQSLAGAGLYPEQLRMLQQRYQMGQQLMQPGEAQGRQVGGTYVAASPLEHLANAFRQYAGAKMAKGAIGQERDLTQGLGQARQRYMGALQTAQNGYQAPGDGDMPPDQNRAQQLLMMGAGSGDPAMQNMAHFGLQSEQLQRQNSLLANTIRHQQELENQGRGRLGVSQERVDLMNQQLALRGIRYDPNTNQFVDIRPMAGVKPRSSVLPRSTGAVTPAAAAPPSAPPPSAPPPPGDGSAPPQAAPLDFSPKPLGKWQDKSLKELGADFNPSSGRNGEFGKNQGRVNAGVRVLALADDNGKARDLSPQQMPEAAQAVASLIGGSSAAQAQIEHLLPKSYSRDAAGILQYFKNEPVGAGQQAFVQQMIDTAKREMGAAQTGIESVRGQLAQKHQRIIRSNPYEAREVLRGFGWDLGADGKPFMKQGTAPGGAGASAGGGAPERNFTRGPDGKLVEVK